MIDRYEALKTAMGGVEPLTLFKIYHNGFYYIRKGKLVKCHPMDVYFDFETSTLWDKAKDLSFDYFGHKWSLTERGLL